MKRKTKRILLALVPAVGVFTAAFGYLLWWPLPSCSENEFELAVQATADLLHVRLVAKSVSPVDVRFVPGLTGTRRRLHDGISPPIRLGGIGPADPRLSRYSLLATNSQAYVMAFVSGDSVVGIGIQVFGSARLVEALESVLKNWVPTAGIPIETRLSAKPLWENQEKML